MKKLLSNIILLINFIYTFTLSINIIRIKKERNKKMNKKRKEGKKGD